MSSSTHNTLLAVSSLYEINGLELKEMVEFAKKKRKDYVIRQRGLLKDLENKSMSDVKDFFALDKKDEDDFDLFDYHAEQSKLPLPEYCLTSKGIAVERDGHFDFDDYSIYKEELLYYFFDLGTCDPILQEEISNMGMCEVIGNDDLRPIFANFDKLKYYQLKKGVVPGVNYIIVEINYTCDYWGEGDCHMGVVGFLNNKLCADFSIKEEQDRKEREYWDSIGELYSEARETLGLNEDGQDIDNQ